MLRELLGSSTLHILPLLAMCIFLAMFVGVVVHALQRARRPQFDHMASLPLEDDSNGVKQ